jgi:uncharacterized protein YifN (PemK superfamily)
LPLGKLKENQKLRNSLKGVLSTALSNLDELCENQAEMFVRWVQDKSLLYKRGLLKESYHPLPNKIERGDIVMCELGINVPFEFGNDGTGKHYVIVWAQQGHNLIVIPITKQAPPEANVHTIKIGEICGMPEKVNYAKLDAIRTVSLRRIHKVFGQKDGKIVDSKIIPIINKAIIELFTEPPKITIDKTKIMIYH